MNPPRLSRVPCFRRHGYPALGRAFPDQVLTRPVTQWQRLPPVSVRADRARDLPTSADGITLSDEEGQGERAPSRRYARRFDGQHGRSTESRTGSSARPVPPGNGRPVSWLSRCPARTAVCLCAAGLDGCQRRCISGSPHGPAAVWLLARMRVARGRPSAVGVVAGGAEVPGRCRQRPFDHLHRPRRRLGAGRAEGTGRCCMGRRPGRSRPARGGRTLVPPVW